MNAITWTEGPPTEHMRDGRDILVCAPQYNAKPCVAQAIDADTWVSEVSHVCLETSDITHHAEINAPANLEPRITTMTLAECRATQGKSDWARLAALGDFEGDDPDDVEVDWDKPVMLHGDKGDEQ